MNNNKIEWKSNQENDRCYNIDNYLLKVNKRFKERWFIHIIQKSRVISTNHVEMKNNKDMPWKTLWLIPSNKQGIKFHIRKRW